MVTVTSLRISCVLALVSAFLLFPYEAFAQDEIPIEEPSDEVPVTGAAPKTPPPAQPPPPTPPPTKPAPPPAKPVSPQAAPAAEAGGEEDPSRPPPRGKAVVWGVITDAKLSEPIPDAEVSIVGKKKKITTATDLDGRYRLELDPGTYDIRFWAEVHQAQVVKGVTVEVGNVAQLDADLAPDESAVDVVEVETTAEHQAVEGQILTRQRSAAVGDSVGRQDIAKTPDRNAAQSAQRIVGATIVNNRFVYVRGLGERYTNAQLNGTPLPSPEPDVNAVPLDLFPSLVLDSVTISKTFTPDVPGDFAGGSVRIETREIPSKFLFSPTVSVGFNTETTFRDRLSYRGSSTDWLGFDNGLRSLPSDIPKYQVTQNGPKPGGGTITPAELERYGESINTYMSARREFTPPNYGGNLVVGNGFDLGGGRRLGYLAALTYSRAYQIRHEIYREYRLDPDLKLTRNLDYNIESGIDAVKWGAFGSVTYLPAKGHHLTLMGLHSQLSDNTARWIDSNYKPGQIGTIPHQTRLSFISRELTSGELIGEHELKPLNRAIFDWSLSLSHAGRDEPNTRDDVWEDDPERAGVLYGYAGSNAQAGRHLYADQGEMAYGGAVNFTQPVVEAPRDTKLKVGGAISLRKREFKARRFNYAFGPEGPDNALVPPIACGPIFKESCADALFRNENIGPLIQLNESTKPSDAYDAKLNVYATYFMGDISLTKDLRAIAGERVEVTRQSIDPVDQFKTGAKLESADLQSTDLLPAVGLIYDTTKKSKLRVSLTRTLARPQLRELAPFEYNEIVGGRTVTGNEHLKLTKITNGDIRFEYYPTLREVLAMSVFAKHFVDPIESVIIITGGSNELTFENSKSANLIGLELEARKSLEFLHEELKRFSIIANLTLAHSEITIRQTATNFITNTSRALSNQAPYVVNVSLDYTGDHGFNARLLYNVVGTRVVEVGTGRIDDSYEHARHRIDAAVSQDLGQHFNVKLTGENLLNTPVLITVGSESRNDNIVRKYTEGILFTLSAQYTY